MAETVKVCWFADVPVLDALPLGVPDSSMPVHLPLPCCHMLLLKLQQADYPGTPAHLTG